MEELAEWKLWVLGTVVLPAIVWISKVLHMKWKLIDTLGNRIKAVEEHHTTLSTSLTTHIDKTEKGFDRMLERMDATHELIRTDIRELTKAILDKGHG